MTVTPCQNIAERFVGFNYDSNVFLSIDKTTSPEEFDKQWIEKYGEIPLTAQVDKYMGLHALCIAARPNNVALIHHIYQKNKYTLDLGDERGWTPLFHAIWMDALEAATTLIELGVDSNIATIRKCIGVPQGATCLWYAATHFQNDVTLCKLLLKYGAVVAPTLDEQGKLNLKKAQVALEEEIALIKNVLNCETTVTTAVLQQLIVEYV